MQINKNNNESKEIELTVELSVEEMKPHIEQATDKISKDVKIDGFRPGHIPYDVLKKQVGEMAIIQEAANLAIQKTADNVIKDNVDFKIEEVVGRPEVKLTKVAADSPIEYKIIMQLMPEITLGKYKELGIKPKEIKLEDKEIEKVITDLRNMRAKEVVVDREIKDGDKATVNIQMFLDNVPVEGGQSQDTAVMVGADYIIPGFDKELIGAKKGETKEFKLQFPTEHYQKNLAGKMVDFKVAIKDVYERELPELNEEFVKTLGVKNAEELKSKIKENLENDNKQKTEQKTVLEIFEKIIDKTKFSHIPESMIHSESHNMIHELKKNVEQQGGKFEDYLMHVKKTSEELEQDFKPDAAKRVKTSLMISQVVKAEKIEVAKEELEAKVVESLKAYESNEEMKKKADTAEFRNYLQYNLLNKKVIEKLKEWNVA